MNWMRHLDYRFERFIGIDIVESIIHTLKTEPFPPSHHFQTGNIVTDILPQADLLFCRDCLVHLPLAAIAQVQLLWKPAGFTYVMATTFPEAETNEDCQAGDWRQINLRRPPFDWPEPLAFLREYAGPPTPGLEKCMGLWEVSQLP